MGPWARARAQPWQGHGQYKFLARLSQRASGGKPSRKTHPGETDMLIKETTVISEIYWEYIREA